MMDSENEQKLIFSGRTVEEALQNARDKLGLEPYTQLSYKVINDPAKKKFLLFGGQKKEVKIEIHFSKNGNEDEASEHHDVKQMVADVWNTDSSQQPPRQKSQRSSSGAHRRNAQRPHRSEGGAKRRRSSRHPQGVSQESNRANRSQSARKPSGPPITDEALQLVDAQLKSILSKMGLEVELTVERSIKNPGIIRVQPEGTDYAWLYSQKDAFIQSLEELILKMLRTRYDEEQRCQLYFVGLRSFKRNRTKGIDEKKLAEEVESCIARIHETGEPVTIGPFNAFERRLIHRQVSEVSGLTTESHGEGTAKMITIQKAG